MEGCFGVVDMPHLQSCPGSGSHTLVAWFPLPYYSPAIGTQGKWASLFHKRGPSHILSTIRFRHGLLRQKNMNAIQKLVAGKQRSEKHA